MRSLSRITTEYVGAEDRIRISGRVEQDRICVLWLTQRLTRQLVPVLLTWLRENTEPNSIDEVDIEGSADDAPSARRAVSRASEGRSIAGITRETPPERVRAEQAEEQWLVKAVDLKRGDKGVGLLLRGGKREQQVGLRLTAEQLEQWLGIVMDCHLRATWPMDQWPDWMSSRLPGRLNGALH